MHVEEKLYRQIRVVLWSLRLKDKNKPIPFYFQLCKCPNQVK